MAESRLTLMKYKFAEIFRGLLEPVFAIGVSKVHDVVNRHQHLFNFPWLDEIISQSINKFQPP